MKGFHYHKKQTDSFICVFGEVKIVLFDSREGSPTEGGINEFFSGPLNPRIVQIPPGILHGFKGLDNAEPYSLVVNCTNQVYDGADEYRCHPHDPDKQAEQIGRAVPYSWERKDG